MSYILLPALKILLQSNSALLQCGALYLCYTLLKTINDEDFQEAVCILLFGKEVPKEILLRIENIDKDIYIPRVYQE